MNPFTAVKNQFFSTYAGGDDHKQTNGDSNGHQHHHHQHHNQSYQTSPSRTYHRRKKFTPTANGSTTSNGRHHHHYPHRTQHMHNRHTTSTATNNHKPYSSPPQSSSSSGTRADRSLAERRCELIADYLHKVPLLARLSREDRYNLSKSFKQKIFSQNETVIAQHEPGHEFFIITKGDASVVVDSDMVATLYPGDYFGETALLTSRPRNATVKANERALHCLVLDKQTFIDVFGKERVRVNFGKRGAVSAESYPNLHYQKQHAHTLHDLHPKTRMTKKNAATKELVVSAIENNILFAALDEQQIERIVDEMWMLQVTQGESIITQGDAGDNFYVVEQGMFHIFVVKDGDEKLVATRSSGESFGELALMYNSPRSATVTAMTSCRVWAVERFTFRRILIRVSEQKLKEYERFLKQVTLLDALLVNERRAVAQALNEVVFQYDDVVVQQGDIGDTFYIIRSGTADVFKHTAAAAMTTTTTTRKSAAAANDLVAQLESGSFFGERALIKNQVRAATVRVTSAKMVCLTLDREAFSLLLGPLAELLQRKIDEDYDGVVRSHDDDDMQNDAAAAALVDANGMLMSAAAATDSEYVMQHQYFSHVCDGAAATDEYKSEEQRGGGGDIIHGISPMLSSGFSSRPPAYKLISFSDLVVIGLLGRGSFGCVQLVQDERSGHNYALKTVSKAQIVKTGQQQHIISEKNVMRMLDLPFTVKLYETYNIDKYLYFLLEVVLGGELFSVLRARTVFDEATARFYTASVVFAFDYMHSKCIVYRDLKPENLLLNDAGYLKITDFGFAKIVADRTYTLCGTPDYLAPEVISGAGHSRAVDWWTLGVLLFEMLASYPPFYHEDPMKTYAKIMHGRVNYPKHFSVNAVEIIKSFINAKPTKRLGIIHGGLDAIKSNAWFDAFDWDALQAQQMTAPIVPHIKNRHDRSNFETVVSPQEQKLIDQQTAEAEQYLDDGSGWDQQF